MKYNIIYYIMNIFSLLKIPIIPLNIFQTWHTKDLPEKMKDTVELFKSQNPEFTHYLFDDNDCREFIKYNFDSDVLNAYDSLISGAYKADLWRLCVLYIHGGIYADIKISCVNKFKLSKLIYNSHFVKDRPKNSIYNAFIVSNKRNLFLYKGIRQIVENVQNKYYGSSSLSPTGPIMLGSIIKKYNLNVNIDLNHHLDGGYIIYKDKNILSTEYMDYRREQTNVYSSINSKHYNTLWNEKNIYK